jgi:2-hydroxymuconate-semialdehyde hydrolase
VGLVALLGVAAVATLLGVPAGFRLLAASREVHTRAQVAPGTFLTVDELELHTMTWGPEAGPLILLVPGTSAWAHTWVELAEPLAARGFHVVAMDLPPFGYSERPTDDTYDRPAQAARILGVLDALDARRAVLVGHSFGGGATVEAAMGAPPGQLAQLVLLSPALGLGAADSPVAPLMRIPTVREPLVSMTFTSPAFLPVGVRAMMADPSQATAERVARYQQPLDVQGTTRAVGAWLPELLAPTSARSHDPEAYRTLALPTTLVWGSHDTVTPLAQGQALAALLPDARLVVLDDVGHLPQLEDVPGVLAALEPALSAQPMR